MNTVSDDFLLNVAEVSAAFVGLFLVGTFFFVETGFRRPAYTRESVWRYFRAGTQIVLVLYAIPIALSLTLVALEPAWNRAVFIFLSLLLIASNVDSATRLRGAGTVLRSRILVANEVIGTIAVIVLVPLPWVLGGWEPSREDFTWSILISFAAGFLSVCAMVLSVFDLASTEVSD